jgi:hypothetical protein
MKSLFTLFTLMVFAIMVFSSSELSYAAPVQWGTPGKKLSGTAITEQVSGVVGDATKASRTISYGIGGLGAVALGALAFFGRYCLSSPLFERVPFSQLMNGQTRSDSLASLPI